MQTDSTNKQKVVDLLKSIETGDPAPIAYINPNKYIQHNLSAADGLAGFGALMQQLPPGSARAHTVRAFEDDNYVFTHTEYNFFGPKIGFDIFRFEDGLIVEHWDNLQEAPSEPNPSGHTMLDGATRIEDLDKTFENKGLVREFVEDILINRKLQMLSDYLDDHYIQHNPMIGDGVRSLKAAFEAMDAQGQGIQYDQIHLLLGEGNFVLVQSEANLGSQPKAQYDLFRVDKGKIVEHWDVSENIPPRSEWKNDNGKF